jgi:hypothetical protein
MSNYNDFRLSADTTPESEALYFELLSKKTPAEKLRMMSKMNAAVRALAMSGLRNRHPGETELQLKIRLAEILHGSEIAAEIAERLNKFQSDE